MGTTDKSDTKPAAGAKGIVTPQRSSTPAAATPSDTPSRAPRSPVVKPVNDANAIARGSTESLDGVQLPAPAREFVTSERTKELAARVEAEYAARAKALDALKHQRS